VHGKKEEGRRKKEEGRRKKEEGRRKKEEGRREYSHSNSFSYQKLPNIQLSVGIKLFNS